MRRLDWFVNPSVKVWQDSDYFCFNTDSVLLAGFVKVRHDDKVLEIGCGNGALLVWMDQFEPKVLDGVEILEGPAQLTIYNKEQFIKSPGQVLNQDVKTLEGQYTLIVSNPPFFPVNECEGVKKDHRWMGRFEKNLDLESLIQSAARLLGSNGRFATVHRPERMMEIMTLLNKYNFGLKRMQIAYDRRDNQAKALLVEAIKDQKPQTKVEEPAWIG